MGLYEASPVDTRLLIDVKSGSLPKIPQDGDGRIIIFMLPHVFPADSALVRLCTLYL